MLSIRPFARLAPRVVSRLTSSAARLPVARQVSLLQPAWKPARSQYAATFSTSTIRAAKAAEGDDELVAKLESEIEMENEMKEEGGVPTSIKDYLENGPFELQDIPGREDVTLTRQFGDET
jgi:complement component 1 Q subcomponent-binding protein, mitochondrial